MLVKLVERLPKKGWRFCKNGAATAASAKKGPEE